MNKTRSAVFNQLRALCQMYVQRNEPTVYAAFQRELGIVPKKKRTSELENLYDQAMQGQDACEICLGTKGGWPGNENIINGKRVCDYCHAEMIKAEKTT